MKGTPPEFKGAQAPSVWGFSGISNLSTKKPRTSEKFAAIHSGRGGGIRTPDPLLPKQMR